MVQKGEDAGNVRRGRIFPDMPAPQQVPSPGGCAEKQQKNADQDKEKAVFPQLFRDLSQKGYF